MYRAAILLLTGGLAVLHLLEWRAAVSVLPVPRVGGEASARGLRTALRLEALYYLLALPAYYARLDSLVGRLMAVFAAFHWGGLVLYETTRVIATRSGAAGGKAIWTIAVFDVAEMAVLVLFSERILRSLASH